MAAKLYSEAIVIILEWKYLEKRECSKRAGKGISPADGKRNRRETDGFKFMKRSDFMVFYFSGTGNSALVARQIAEGLGDEMVSINQCLKEKETKNFRAKEPLIFVAPTYAWQMPKVVHRWIQESSFSRQAEGLFSSSPAREASAMPPPMQKKKLCLEKNLLFCGLAPVIMPNNYVALSDTPDKKSAMRS